MLASRPGARCSAQTCPWQREVWHWCPRGRSLEKPIAEWVPFLTCCLNKQGGSWPSQLVPLPQQLFQIYPAPLNLWSSVSPVLSAHPTERLQWRAETLKWHPGLGGRSICIDGHWLRSLPKHHALISGGLEFLCDSQAQVQRRHKGEIAQPGSSDQLVGWNHQLRGEISDH